MAPLVFISHSSEDAKFAKVLKRCICKTFPGRCEVFVSSTHESNPPGTLWFQQIKKKLNKAQLVLTLIGPRTKDRPWIFFESGAAWLKNVGVVPIIHSGLKVNELNDPLKHFKALSTADNDFVESLLKQVATDCSLGPVPGCIKLAKFSKEISKSLASQCGPREVVRMWNESLLKGEVEVARKLMSETITEAVINERYGSLEELAKRAKASGYCHNLCESEHIEGNLAKVTYLALYDKENFAVKLWTDFLFLESNQWRIAPQYVVWKELSQENPNSYQSRLLKNKI